MRYDEWKTVLSQMADEEEAEAQSATVRALQDDGADDRQESREHWEGAAILRAGASSFIEGKVWLSRGSSGH